MDDSAVSRRTFLKSSAALGSSLSLGTVFTTMNAEGQSKSAPGNGAPPEATVLTGFLAAKIQWVYANWEVPHSLTLSVAAEDARDKPIVRVSLPGSVTTHAFAVVPNKKYIWQLQSTNAANAPVGVPARGEFKTGEILLKQDAPHDEQFSHVRKGAHNPYYKSSLPFVEEPLSPWYEVKHYTMAPPPTFVDIQDHLPKPVWDGNPDALAMYWYCWRIFFSEKRTYAPAQPDHQAIANICGISNWGHWGSGMVLDQWVMMRFAKYANQAYPVITQFDNAYARQHENGFICQESDNNNCEVYALFPAQVVFLIGWAEWDYYLVSGDVDRLRRVFIPLVKNYEWFMTYMRKEANGMYGVETPARMNELVEIGPDSLELGATALRAAETLAMARIATVVGRPDMASFFMDEHRRLAAYINQNLWDAEHQLYNDRCGPNNLWKKYRSTELAGKFVTEATSGDINKSVFVFTTLFSEVVPKERVAALQRLAQDPQGGFAWPNGVGYVSVDSAPQGEPKNPDYFGPTRHNIAVWPSSHYLMQDGFAHAGKWTVAQEAAERYHKGLVGAYKKDPTLAEALDPVNPIHRGMRDFIGWSGLGPIANFIEYVLGFDVNAPANTITWHVIQPERHGLQHFKFGTFFVDMLCEAGANAGASRQITVNSGGTFTLQTVVGEKATRHKIRNGTTTIMV